jgi:hypothetical protein
VVISGQLPAVVAMDAGDPRLEPAGLARAIVQVTVDPNAISPKPLPAVMTDEKGRFSIEIPEPGAGFLEYEVALSVRHPLCRPQETLMLLPGSDKRLLVILQPGPDVPPRRDNILEDTLRQLPPTE